MQTRRRAKRLAKRERRSEKRRRNSPGYRLGAWWARQTDALGIPRGVSLVLGLILYAPVFVVHVTGWAVLKVIDAAVALVRNRA